jgi:predicted Zn-dependent peptidase
MNLAGSLIPLLLVAAKPAPAPQIPVETFTLDNGLTVVLSEDHSAPVVTTFITYKIGSAAEKEGYTGFAHLFEHMMFNGSENVPEGAYSFYVDGTGGVLNGNTEPDRTNYFEVMPSNYLEGSLWLEADRMRSLVVTDAALDNEKQVVKEEVRQQQENQPFVKTILLDWPSVAFSSWAYSHSIYGSMEDLNAAPEKAFQDFFDTYYVPNNAVLVLCGDFEPAKARKLVEKHFGAIPKGPENTYAFPKEDEQTQAVYKEVTDPLAPIGLALVSWDIPQPRTADRDALELLATVLSDGGSARLNRVLVDEKKLAAGVQMASGFPIPTYGPGQLAVLLPAAKDVKLETLRAAFWEEIETVQKKGVSKKELARAKAKKRKQFVNGMGSTGFKARRLATYEAFYGGAKGINEDYGRYDKITAKDLQRVAKQYLTQPRSVTFDILPGKK